MLTRGATDADLDWLGDIPGLEAARAWSEDERLAEHERVLGRGVFAFRSVFTRDDALRVDAPSPWFAKHGLTADDPDSLGAELALYAETGDPELGRSLAWAMPALVAIERQGGPLYPVVARMTRELLAPAVGDVALPDVTDPLDDAKTGLRRLAEYLLIPVKSGFFLSRGDLLRVAKLADSPCGFGSRTQMMEAYFRTAVEHERLPEAVAVLDDELSVWQGALSESVPAWSVRAAHTRRVVERLAKAVTDLA